MKKTVILPIVVLIVLGFFYAGCEVAADRYFPHRNITNELKPRSDEPVLGIYDPDSTFLPLAADSLHHYVLSLKGGTDWEVDMDPLQKLDPNTPLLLTVEIWEISVLDRMTEGFYDEKLGDLLSSLVGNRKNVFLRWNPEMEVPASGYPWGNRGSIYADAFKKFSILAREEVPEAKIVWGPAGYPGLMENHPGTNHLDVASITLNSNAEKNSGYEVPMDLDQITRKLHRMRFLQVPVLILGSENIDPSNFDKKWVRMASKEIEQEKEAIQFKEVLPKHPESESFKRQKEVMIGLFDPKELLVEEETVSVEHIFIDFAQIRDGSYIEYLQDIFSRNHDAIISVEPAFYNQSTTDERQNLKRILNGEYDDLFRYFYQNIPKTNQTIYLRFAHEMEIPIKRYPWQSQDPVEYIKAFRYFMQFPEEDFPNIKKVWGPAGDRGLLEWWPGEDVVDIVSIAIYGLPDKNITDPEMQESFEDIFHRKNNRINLLNKPLFITEFGVKGDEEFQTRWLMNAAKVIRNEQKIIGVSYFNREDVAEAWGDIKPPEWSISKETFHSFLDALGPVVTSTPELQ